ncbi:MAG TPA: tetratricopeptide repeat protein [Bryobacteraceae bacterium]|jgi:tetratricopeptide (TPR) repeat protein|nr:tetratricopeptide repeat protein [Bryobacteraceae bacterium]
MMTALLILLIANSAYLSALPAANLFYIANIPLHLALGTLVTATLIWQSRKSPKTIPLFLAALIGIYLISTGATTGRYKILEAHIALAVLGIAIIKPRYTLALATLTFIAAALRFGQPKDRIVNPKTVPTAMTEEGEGPRSPFWPSSSRTSVGGIMPSDFFMESQQCGECHKDIYEQWKSSMHHFASFNNQFYKASILHMQELSGTQGSKWCAACHDHAVFFNGRFEIPIKQQADTPEAQNGLGCVSCHSITHVGSTMGNADFEIAYPPLHRLASSKNSFVQASEKFLTYLNPEPHRRTFMKPFMRDAEFCAACHKVHLDEPVNHYRWIRGFNDYDNWQASGVSGQGARSFYYPQKSQACADCHMAQVPSNDPGNRDGMIHSHRFAAANTAIPTVNHDDAQQKATEAFLKSGFITVDLFAASPVETAQKGDVQMKRRADNPTLSSTFAVGEEAEQSGPVTLREVGKIAAPIDAPGVSLSPGTVRIDAVVRTRKIGHFFPAGTVDSFDVWLEFSARDAKGRILALSGAVDGNGPVDRSAHFYRSYLLDSEGNAINKRNAWQARSVFYVRLIPPGAADTVHYLVNIPQDAVGPITFEANLNYRKFTDAYTRFTFGAAKPGLADVSYDNREYVSDPAKTPVLPIVTLASATATVPLGDPYWQPVIRKQDRERWNDWGIGLLLQGDLKGAEYAFHRVTEAEPSYPDGYVNIARALIQEGETEAARPFLEKALQLSPKLARAEFFLATVQKTAGDYDGALANLADVRRQYPRDRVVVDQVGRIMFLQRRYSEAIATLKDTLTIDPEDLQAHYNLMLCYRGLGQNENAAREQKLFLRFKADESAQSLTGKPRLEHPEENNERQSIHDHDALPPFAAKRL